ncbi:Spy/CpxP family protein refolding chaperone [Flavobacterium aciduliphilum]|nr:hypothetical protein [Flavobacterium aciduliphilum]
MDIFKKHQIATRIIFLLVFLNLSMILFFFWREYSVREEPLLFPKNEAYKDVSGILKEALNLTKKQESQFEAIREKYFRKEAFLKQIIREDKDLMNENIFNKSTDSLIVKGLAKQISANEYKMELLRYQQAQEFKSVCTAQQQEKFKNLVREIRDYFRPDNQPYKR